MEYILYHSGIKGMKWGVRRYQNKDGTLTALGRRRLAKETEKANKEAQVLKNRKATQAKIDRLEKKRAANEELKKKLDGDSKKQTDPDSAEVKKSSKKTEKKTIKDMSDVELIEAINRARLEQTYTSLVDPPPPQVKKGDGFVKEMWNRSAVPAIQDAGKTLIRDSILKAGKKYLGLETNDDELAVLKKEAERLDLTNKINTYKNKIKNNGQDKFEQAKEEADYWTNLNKAAQQKRQYEKTTGNNESRQTNNDRTDNASTESNSNTGNGAGGKKNKNKNKNKTDKTVYEGTVEGEGTSKGRSNKGKKWTNDTIIDADFTEVVNNSSSSYGRDYVSNFLSLPANSYLALPASDKDD